MGERVKGYLETRQLRYFRAIAANGSLSGAARSLHIAQSALSYNIAELEAQVGALILKRHRSGVSLTEEGRVLLQYAIQMADIAEQAESALSSAGRSEEKRPLRLGIISSIAASLAPLVAVSAAESLPSIMLRISETGTVNSLRLMEEGKLDAAIHLVRPRGLPCIRLVSERLFFVSRTVDPAPRGPIPFCDLAQMDLILPARGNPLRDLLEKKAAAAGIRLRIALEIDGWAPRRNAIRAGLGATVFGAHSVMREKCDSQITVRPIVRPALHRPIYLCTCPNLDRSLTRQLQELLQGAMSQPEFRFSGTDDPITESDQASLARRKQIGYEHEV